MTHAKIYPSGARSARTANRYPATTRKVMPTFITWLRGTWQDHLATRTFARSRQVEKELELDIQALQGRLERVEHMIVNHWTHMRLHKDR